VVSDLYGQFESRLHEQVWLLDRRAVEELAGAGDGIAIWEEEVLGLTKSLVLSRRYLSDRSR